MKSYHLVGEVGVQSHSRAASCKITSHVTRVEGTYAKATGRLVRKPNMNDPTPAIAAVEVTRSRFTSVKVSIKVSYNSSNILTK